MIQLMFGSQYRKLFNKNDTYSCTCIMIRFVHDISCIFSDSSSETVLLRKLREMGRKWYGGNNRRGTRTEHFRKANAGIIRSVLLQLEEMKVTEKTESGGRQMTRVGQQDLDRIAGRVFADEEED